MNVMKTMIITMMNITITITKNIMITIMTTMIIIMINTITKKKIKTAVLLVKYMLMEKI
jgi:hypothetical protein